MCFGHSGILGCAALHHSGYCGSPSHDTWMFVGQGWKSSTVSPDECSNKGWYHLSLSLVSKATFNYSMKRQILFSRTDREYLIPKYPTAWAHSILHRTEILMLEQPQPKARTKLSSPTTQTNVLTMSYMENNVSLYSVRGKKQYLCKTCHKSVSELV